MDKQKILVIEDDASLRRVTEFSLEEAGFRVVVASNGEEGLLLFRKERPDLVITDIQMPGMSGYQVLEQIRDIDPSALIVMITAFGSVENAVAAMKMGAYDYITKPFGRDELVLVVQKALSFSRLKKENVELRRELGIKKSGRKIIAASKGMEKLFALIDRVAASDATVLITGESGTGKELVARTVHEKSDRAEAAFVAVNCAAIPAELLESELFGHVKGSFTGAVKDREGKFQQADGGTIFLDEIGDLPLSLQPKLLRVLQEQEVEPVGGRTMSINVRIVAATNRELEQQMDDGNFREDLYYRLAVIPLELPPLRYRKEDIPLLIDHFISKDEDKLIKISTEAVDILQEYRWPGNVRELENLVERLLVLRQGDIVGVDDLPARIKRGDAPKCAVLNLPDEGYSLEELERQAVVEALERHRWNKARAAKFLQIPRHTLVYRLEKYGIVRGS